jgi:hypothetical protein
VAEKRWPNLFVVGAPRAGTSSLWSYLDQHPEIFMSRLKEPHFFSSFKPDFIPVVSDEAEYLRLFAGAAEGRLLGEATPTYLADAEAPGAIARMSPEARIVIILREPVSRAYSSYWHKVRYGREERPFLEVVRARLRQRDAVRPRPNMVGSGLYVEPVRRYLGAFGERVLILIFEEFAADVRGHVRRAFEFLELDPAPADRIRLEPRNVSALPRNALVRRLYRSGGLRAATARIVPSALHPRLERVLLRRVPTAGVDPEAGRLLEELYAAERPELEELLGQRLPWPPAS